MEITTEGTSDDGQDDLEENVDEDSINAHVSFVVIVSTRVFICVFYTLMLLLLNLGHKFSSSER